MLSDTALAISFINGNRNDVARACRRDGLLAVQVALEMQRLGHREAVATFATLLEAVPKKVRRVPKKPVADRTRDASMTTSADGDGRLGSTNGERNEEPDPSPRDPHPPLP